MLYGVDRRDVEVFKGSNPLVAEFVRRYKDGKYARALCMFFRWLKVVKGVEISPREFLNLHIKKRASLDIHERRWAVSLVLQFSRDNPDLEGKADNYKYLRFVALKQFFSYNEAELTSGKNVFGKRAKRKYSPRQISVDDARRILGVMPQVLRSILLVLLQSGMSIGDCLNKFNFMREYVESCLAADQERIRVDFKERKGNSFSYFTFISRDAIQELKKWFVERARLENGKSDAIFITQRGTTFNIRNFNTLYLYHLKKNHLKKGPFTVTSHMFRKLFETESDPPERGISSRYIAFMCGRASGDGVTDPMQVTGGTYRRTPELYPDTVEREYQKLEPYINIFTGKPARRQALDLTEEQLRSLLLVAKKLKEGKIKIEER